jgi:Domain of unknown function (DUF4280)
MPQQTCTTAQIMCSFGASPMPFNAGPVRKVLTSNLMAGNIMDNKPIVNIPPFVMCTSLANPAVASATAAALGVLTPMPCMPVIAAPWAPGVPNVLVENQLALDNNCKLMCNWAGVISFVTPGQFTHEIP